MSFSCGCDDSDFGIVAEYECVWTEHMTIKCFECGCELGPGHVVHVTAMAEFRDEPFEDMDGDRLEGVLASEDTVYHRLCERCGDLGDAVADTGMCWSFGELWESYFDWLRLRGAAILAMPGRFGATKS